MEALVDATKAVDRAVGVEEIFFPGELEDRSHAVRSSTGIPVADNTWDSLTTLARSD